METSLYIHIPFCKSKCAYCDFFSILPDKKNSFVPDSYIDAVCNEIAFKAKKYAIEKWNTIYIGGGTPSILSSDQIKKIASTIFSCVKFKECKEFTFEINPDDACADLFDCLQDIGVTRISCGIQSFNNEVLHFANRRASFYEIKNCLSFFEKYNSIDFSVDLISGLPGETLESFAKGLKILSDYKISHVSMYSLTIEENTVLGKLIDSGKLEYDYDFADELWLAGRNILEKMNFLQYEVSNFSKPKKQCLHNMVYWNLENYIGCGAGATGSFYEKEPCRITNINDVSLYTKFWLDNCKKNLDKTAFVEEFLNPKTIEFEYLMMGLRTFEGISLEVYEERFNKSLSEKKIEVLKRWESQKKVRFYKKDGKTNVSMTKDGILLLNRLLLELV